MSFLALSIANINGRNMPRPLDPKIGKILEKHGFDSSAVWDCHGTWVIYHKVLEQIAAAEEIKFDSPMVVQSCSETKSVALCVTGHTERETEWSIGEASPSNNKNNYPWAMAEKFPARS